MENLTNKITSGLAFVKRKVHELTSSEANLHSNANDGGANENNEAKADKLDSLYGFSRPEMNIEKITGNLEPYSLHFFIGTGPNSSSTW